jgi:hypothetical protein
MNAFLEHGMSAVPEKRQAAPRPEKPLSALEKKMREKQRLSRSFRAWRRAEVKAVLASEPRLSGFLRYLRTVTPDKGDELLEALTACEWLRAAPLNTRIFALRMISARADKLNRMMGNEALDDPLPPETSIYFVARDLLHAGGRA